MNKYLKSLVDQYQDATGIKKIDFNSDLFRSDLKGWILSRKDMSNNYTKLLNANYMFDKPIIEVGKGKYDSLVNSFDSIVITPYTDSFTSVDDNHLINSEFAIYNGNPYLVTTDYNGYKRFDIIDRNFIFMTQNPYILDSISRWFELANNGDSNIILGIYGDVADRDYFDKHATLERVKYRLDDSYIEESTTDNGCYYSFLGTSKYKKYELIKTMIQI